MEKLIKANRIIVEKMKQCDQQIKLNRSYILIDKKEIDKCTTNTYTLKFENRNLETEKMKLWVELVTNAIKAERRMI